MLEILQCPSYTPTYRYRHLWTHNIMVWLLLFQYRSMYVRTYFGAIAHWLPSLFSLWQLHGEDKCVYETHLHCYTE